MTSYATDLIRQNPQEPPSLFDALKVVEQAANQEWHKAATARVRYLCQTRVEWTGDDVWQGLENVHTKEPRALGAVIRHAAEDGWCSPSGEYIRSSRKQNHGRPVAKWYSHLINAG